MTEAIRVEVTIEVRLVPEREEPAELRSSPLPHAARFVCGSLDEFDFGKAGDRSEPAPLR